MIRGMYTAAAGMLTEQRKHDAITSNIANINTPGFKSQQPIARSFPEVLIALQHRSEAGSPRGVGTLHTGVMVEEHVPIFTQGDLAETGRAGDIALVSDEGVFFTLWNEHDEVRYTRNGQLYVDDQGSLRNVDGFRVLGQNEVPIQLERDLEHVVIGPTGQFYDRQTGQPLTDGAGEPMRLQLSLINDPYALMREGNGAFRLINENANLVQTVEQFDNVAVQQGHIERSNVDSGKAIVELNTALKAYEANQKVIQSYDRSLEKAVNEIGRVQG